MATFNIIFYNVFEADVWRYLFPVMIQQHWLPVGILNAMLAQNVIMQCAKVYGRLQTGHDEARLV